MKTKVKTISVQSPFGGDDPIYPVMISFENGDDGVSYAKKNPPPYGPGDDVEIESYGSDRDGNTKYRVKKDSGYSGGSKGGFGGKGSGFKSDPIGQMVGNAINNAVLLVCHGQVEIAALEATARRICQISIALKAEFSKQEAPTPQEESKPHQEAPKRPAALPENMKPVGEPTPVDELDDEDIPF